MDSNELRHWREAHGLSQSDLAQRLGVSNITVWRWEHEGSAEHRTPPHWLQFALPQIEQQLQQQT